MSKGHVETRKGHALCGYYISHDDPINQLYPKYPEPLHQVDSSPRMALAVLQVPEVSNVPQQSQVVPTSAPSPLQRTGYLGNTTALDRSTYLCTLCGTKHTILQRAGKWTLKQQVTHQLASRDGLVTV